MEKDIYEEIRDPEFANHFLGRLVSDCEYILNACMDAYEKGYANSKKGSLRHLWAQNDVDEQISLMRACKKTLDKAKIKSRISDEDIDRYEIKLKKIESLKEASTLSYKTKDGEVLNFYNDENFPVSLNEIPYKNDFDLYKRVYLSIALRYFKACDIHEYNDLKNNALRVLMHFSRFRDLIDQIEEMLESMYEELEYAEYQAKNGGTYYTKRDYDIIKDCVEDMEDLLENIKKHSKLSENKSHLLEVYHHPFDRDIETDVIKPYKYYYKSLDFKKDYKTKAYGYENYNIINVSYNGTSRTLKIEAMIGLKAYGDGHEKRCVYKGDRSRYDRNQFEFDEYLSYDVAKIIAPVGLVKTGMYYPTKYFRYSDYHQDAPHKLHWVDHIILDVTKIYD